MMSDMANRAQSGCEPVSGDGAVSISVAPMMKWTDRHCRAFHRSLTSCARLYTEMRTADAIIHGDRRGLLGYSQIEHPVVLQTAGNDPQDLAQAARAGADWGYDEINLNCGCPSGRVMRGAFGVALMADPDRARRCVEAMVESVSVPVTVKCRIGLDTHPDCLEEFVDAVTMAGCRAVIVHARLALTGRISPKDNRRIPPLDPHGVRELKRRRPELTVIYNGGIASLDGIREHLDCLDGVMIGRAAYRNPALLGGIDALVSGASCVSPFAAALGHRSYIEEGLRAGVPLRRMTRHMLGLFAGHVGARRWRQILGSGVVRSGVSGLELYDTALAAVTCD